jgi:sulfoxide reductase heme-binding subunit YedZ
VARSSAWRRRLAWLAVATAGSLPLAKIGLDALRGGLGANPIEQILNRLGFWTLTFVLLALTPTALAIVTGWKGPLRYRRTIGLFAFSYASLHLAVYAGVDQFFDVSAIVQDVVKRKFITIGMLAFALLLPLALTSTDRGVRRLGFVRWKRLHRLVYFAAAAGVVHFVWRVKADLREPLLFASALAVLLAVRLFDWSRAAAARRAVSVDPVASRSIGTRRRG